jgi:hypothetical protein
MKLHHILKIEAPASGDEVDSIAFFISVQEKWGYKGVGHSKI